MQTKNYPIMNFFFKCIYLSLILTLGSCSSAFYDHYTYTETLETKVKANSLIRQSINPYQENIVQVEDFKGQLEKMVTYEKAKSKNEISVKMWEYVNNEKSSLHQFLNLWKEQGTLSPAFTEEFAVSINAIFDKMLDYETKKDTQSENALLNLINTL